LLFIAWENSKSERAERGRLSKARLSGWHRKIRFQANGQNGPITTERKLGRTMTAERHRKGFPDRIAESRAETALEERDGPGLPPSRIAGSFAGGAESGFFFCFFRCAASPINAPETRRKAKNGPKTPINAEKVFENPEGAEKEVIELAATKLAYTNKPVHVVAPGIVSRRITACG